MTSSMHADQDRVDDQVRRITLMTQAYSAST